MLLLFTTSEVILQCFPKEGPSLLQPALQRLLVLILADKESGLIVSSEFNTCQVFPAPNQAHDAQRYPWCTTSKMQSPVEKQLSSHACGYVGGHTRVRMTRLGQLHEMRHPDSYMRMPQASFLHNMSTLSWSTQHKCIWSTLQWSWHCCSRRGPAHLQT